MPRYDFRCDKCQKQYEVQAPADVEVKCPKCQEPMPKVPAKVRFRIK
jgi:putative FmdB family regulatory protein